jgi:hypothetical protein
MRVRQYAEFNVQSRVMPTSAITARLLVEPDEAFVLPRLDPPQHSWSLKCDDPTFDVGRLVENLRVRLEPLRESIAALGQELTAQDPPGRLRFSVVRFFDTDDGVENVVREVTTPDGSIYMEQLLGWVLDSETLSFLLFLTSAGAAIDVYEYD